MKILINALSARRGGGQTYLHHLLEKLPADQGFQVWILAPDTLEIPEGRKDLQKLPVSESIITNPFLRVLWERSQLPKLIQEMAIDVLFAPGGSFSGSIPKTCKVVTTFQNMLPFDLVQRKKYSLGYMRFRNWALERKLLSSMIESDLVIFISKFAESVIREKSRGKIKKGVIIPHGINPAFRKQVGTPLPPPSWLPKEPYLLYVSILDVYKAQLEVIQGYKLLKDRQPALPKLYLVGPEFAPYAIKVRALIQELKLQDSVILKAALPNHELPALYQNALINIFASETENCPFILLEGLAAGRPMLVSTSPPMPEFAEDAVFYFDPKNPTDFATKLEQMLAHPEALPEWALKAEKQSLKFDWSLSAAKTWQAIAELCR